MTNEDFEPDFLVERPATQRFWVVRASGGQFVRHFRQGGVMAIGHLNALGMPEGVVSQVSALDIEHALKRLQPDRSQASITSHAKQAEAFCLAISEGDLVVTLDAYALTIGRVVGQAFVERAPVVVRMSDGSEQKMTHQLRRKVSWGPLIQRKLVPVAMEMTLFAHQTVFNLDRYWTAVYHLLYPCFTFEGKLYLSANISQQSEIDNYAVSQLFALLSGIEVMGKLFATDSRNWSAYPSNLPALRDELDLSLSSKAEFMSPGTIWSTILADGSTLLWVAAIYVMVFGGDLKFFKADGIVDAHTRQKLWSVVIKLLEAHDFKRVRKVLKVDVPRLETKALDTPKKTRRTSNRPVVIKDLDDVGNDGQN